MNSGVYTVAQLNKYIKQLIENDIFLRDILVEGEISNFKAHSSGHMYFTLKDEGGAINSVMFRFNAEGLKFMPENGMKVIVGGYISLYEKTGQYQLYIQTMEPAGKGALYLAYEQLKARLEKAGVFDPKYKKPIPPYPDCVAVITSPTGAAVRDIMQISRRRNPNVKIVILPVLVQGEGAAPDIVRAIRELNEWGGADVAVVGRGGGSIEDLWAFNEEIVARAIFESEIPIISAVGHETDFTIADFIADMRAPTPSAAAELAIPEAKGFKNTTAQLFNRLNLNMEKRLRENRLIFESLINKNVFKYPLTEINNNEIYLYELYKRLTRAVNTKKENIALRFTNLTDGLERLSPLTVMKKGYSLVFNEEGALIKSVKELKPEQTVTIKLSDGDINAVIKE